MRRCRVNDDHQCENKNEDEYLLCSIKYMIDHIYVTFLNIFLGYKTFIIRQHDYLFHCSFICKDFLSY
jgi:hypothetical protein